MNLNTTADAAPVVTATAPLQPDKIAPRWMTLTLWAAGIYNIIYGLAVVLAPNYLFDLIGAPRPLYPQLFQCIGMIVGVYGLGYLIAARDPYRWWPLVLVGLLGKIFGPIGFLWAILTSDFPALFGLNLIANDLIWWVPFTVILYRAWRANSLPTFNPADEFSDLDHALRSTHTDGGQSLHELNQRGRVLLLFVRHLGCTFCREALDDLSRQRAAIEAHACPVVVHMGKAADLTPLLERYRLHGIAHVSDPTGRLYRVMGLKRGTLRQIMFNPALWWRGFLDVFVRRHGIGKMRGDGFQMPGAFVLDQGRIIAHHRHQTSADQPDLCELTTAGTPAKAATPSTFPPHTA